MSSKKHFLQDRAALLLVSGNSFLALLSIVVVLFNLNANQGTANYTIAYRPSLGIDRYTTGTIWSVLSFIAFAVLVFVFSLAMSYRAYPIKRELSLVILGLTIPLLVFSILVSYSLLISR